MIHYIIYKMNYINIAIIGPITVGKSTLVNTLFIDNYSEMNIRRTTMQPQIYLESFRTFNVEQISEINKKSNIKYYNEKNIKIDPVYHNVGFIKDFLRLESHVLLRIHDLPGINDNIAEEVYANYVINNFIVYDIIFFVIDINSSLNTSTEVKILNTILAQIAQQKKEYSKEMILYVVANKYDNANKEYDEMIEQVQKIVNEQLKKYGIANLKHKIIRLSLETSYIYRMKHFNPNELLDIKYIDKLGLDNFPRKVWAKYNEEEKRQHVTNLVNVSDYREMMRECKFEDFKNNLQSDLSANMQYKLMCNQFKIAITNAVNVHYHSYSSGLGLEFLTLMRTIMDIFEKIININKLFYGVKFNTIVDIDTLIKPVVSFIDYYLDRPKTNWISEYTMEIFTSIKKMALITESKVIILMLNEIRSHVVYFYELKLKKQNLDITEGLNYISNLANYLDDDVGKYYENFLMSNTNIYDMCAQEIININNEVLKKCPSINIIKIVANQLKYIYSCIFHSCTNERKPIKYFDAINICSYIFTANDYWNKKIILQTEIYDTDDMANLRYQLYKSNIVFTTSNGKSSLYGSYSKFNTTNDKELEKIDPVLEKYLAQKLEQK